MKIIMEHYVYQIDNLINGKYYRGKHSAENLDNDYMGSGPLIIKAIDKWGIENFKKTILATFPTSDEAYEYEAQVVTMNEVNDPMCYNLQPGGKGRQKVFTDEELREHEKESQRKYEQSPEGKERRKEYNREYYQQNKEEIKEYHQSPKGREAQRKYAQSPKGKEYRREYNQSPAGKESYHKYYQKPEAKERRREHDQRPERKEYMCEYMKEYRAKKKLEQVARSK